MNLMKSVFILSRIMLVYVRFMSLLGTALARQSLPSAWPKACRRRCGKSDQNNLTATAGFLDSRKVITLEEACR